MKILVWFILSISFAEMISQTHNLNFEDSEANVKKLASFAKSIPGKFKSSRIQLIEGSNGKKNRAKLVVSCKVESQCAKIYDDIMEKIDVQGIYWNGTSKSGGGESGRN